MIRNKVGIIAVVLLAMWLQGCSDYRVRFLYPRESQTNFFNERPPLNLFVSPPVDLRPSVEREGRGKFSTLHFPADPRLDQPANMVVQRALMQDLLQTRIASLVHNPNNADYLLESQILSLTVRLKRPGRAWALPLATGVAAGALGGIGTDASHAIKVGLVGVVLGTFLPAPAHTRAMVELRLELKEQATGKVVWSTTCQGDYQKNIRMGLTAREDKKIAEEFLPKALKRANACAVGQLFAFLQELEGEVQSQ